MASYGILILAAGSASRFGAPKQLLPFGGKTLLRHVVDQALAVPDSRAMVVLGAHEADVRQSLSGSEAEWSLNAQWQNGMGASIGQGLESLMRISPEIESVIIAVCDQPHVSTALFQQLIDTRRKSGHGIVASAYDGALGTPALFDKGYFPELAALNGQMGAKSLLSTHAADVSALDFPEGGIDIDTPEDYKRLQP